MNHNVNNKTDSIVIKVAESEIEKREAYQLRYEVFTIELNDQRYADHELREFRDSDDVDGSILIIAKSDNQVIGSVRLKPLKFRNFIGVDDYGFERLAEFLGIEEEQLLSSVAVLDRFVFAKDFRRGRTLYQKLLEEWDNQAARYGVKILVGAVKAQNVRLRNFYKRSLGYKEYPVVSTRDGSQFQCVCRLLNDELGGSDVRD